jgi:hypothetical protein
MVRRQVRAQVVEERRMLGPAIRRIHSTVDMYPAKSSPVSRTSTRSAAAPPPSAPSP